MPDAVLHERESVQAGKLVHILSTLVQYLIFFWQMEDLDVDLAIRSFGNVNKIYVIFRVFNLTSTDVGMKMFVDPSRLNNQCLNFEPGTWFATVTNGA